MLPSEEIEVPWKDQSTRKICACSNPSQRVPSHAGELSTRRQAKPQGRPPPSLLKRPFFSESKDWDDGKAH